MNIIIVDDEKKACTNLINILKDYIDRDIFISGVANSTADAEILINQTRPDAIFLDIEMPNENAFQFLERIAPVDFEVIFVTAFDEYAVRAFKLNALDYILKPISIPELKTAIDKLSERLTYKAIVKQATLSYPDLSVQVSSKHRHQRITLKDTNRTEVVQFKDILFAEAQSSYSRIVFYKDGVVDEMTLSNPLSDYEDLLPAEYFFRIHRSYLINCMFLNDIVSDSNSQVIIDNHYALPVSRRRYLSLIAYLENNEHYIK